MHHFIDYQRLAVLIYHKSSAQRTCDLKNSAEFHNQPLQPLPPPQRKLKQESQCQQLALQLSSLINREGLSEVLEGIGIAAHSPTPTPFEMTLVGKALKMPYDGRIQNVVANLALRRRDYDLWKLAARMSDGVVGDILVVLENLKAATALRVFDNRDIKGWSVQICYRIFYCILISLIQGSTSTLARWGPRTAPCTLEVTYKAPSTETKASPLVDLRVTRHSLRNPFQMKDCGMLLVDIARGL